MTHELITPQPAVIDVGSKFHEDGKGLIIEHAQDIPDEFISQLRGMKADSGSVREKEFMHVAAIPVSVHELWMRRDNYDCTKEDIRETVKKLRAEGLDAFLVTNKRV
jgi:hypothetical protein